ncbi:MAG: hypothetical protein KGZ83_18975 [Sulfuricella sp.]|nr:hypothetical protein [Sulfuricella sp.]
MSWQDWAAQLRQAPQQAVADLLRGAADIGRFERCAPHEFLLAVLPRSCRLVSERLLGEPDSAEAQPDPYADLPDCLDSGLAAWLLAQRQAARPPARKLGAYAAQVCEALQWPLVFALPQTRAALQAERAAWLPWLGALTLSAFRDPEYDYWQVLAARQDDDRLQFFWQSFVVEAGRTRSLRYLNLGLLAFARLPLSADDSLRNPRLQVQALIERYQRRKGWGTAALEELAQALRGVMARNPSLNAAQYRAFLATLFAPLGDDKSASLLSLLGLSSAAVMQRQASIPSALYKLEPPGSLEVHNQAVHAVKQSGSLAQAWKTIHPLLIAHEDYLHKTGDAYYFVRNLDRCARALCEKYPLRDPEIHDRLFQWIHLALRVDADNPRLWMLWELALRQAGQEARAQWVLWEMTRRFPADLHSRLELARLLTASSAAADQTQAQRLLQQVLQLDPDDVHANSTLAKVAIRRRDWGLALSHAQRGLQIDPADGSCAVLLATAYARRNEGDDLTCAIEHLQRFVSRYSGQTIAETYLRKLLKRRELAAQGRLAILEDDAEPSASPTPTPENDPAWRAFAESIRVWVSDAAIADDAAQAERVLPLPLALRQAVSRGLWDDDVVARYDAAAQREFPLETRLWHYLQTLQSNASASERDQTRLAVQTWLDGEARAASQANPSWLPYLTQHWAALSSADETALSGAAEWLKDLLDRYQPLPAPLFE